MKSKIRTIEKIVIVAISFMILLSIGCKSLPGNTKINPYEGKVVGLSMHFMRDDYSVTLVEAFSKVLDEKGIKYIIADGNGDPKKQIADIENLMEQEVDIIAVVPMDEMAVKNTLIEALDEGIPVISITEIPGINVNVTISGGDYANGWGAGKRMVSELNGEGEVVVFNTPFNVNRGNERVRGFYDAIEGTNIQVVATQKPADNEETMEVVKTLLNTYPSLDGIFACFSNQMIGCGAALKAFKRNDIVVTGIDADMSVINMLLDGYLTAAAAQFPSDHGRLTAEAMINILDGKTFQKTYEVPFEMVDKSNAVAMAGILWGKDIN